MEANPTTLPRRVLGRRLTELREQAQMSRDRAAKACEMGSQTLWRLESGRSRQVKQMVVNALCDLYQATAEQRRVLLWLAQEARKDGWWQSYTDAVVPEVELFVGLEQSAERITSWQSMLLPGLLQTPAYRRAMWAVAQTGAGSVDLDRELAFMVKRQERLREPGKRFEAILSEAVLRHRIGGAQVMAEQLRHLLDVAAQPGVRIRIVPFTAPDHLGLTSKDFVFLEFPDHKLPALHEPPVVYVEGYTGVLYLDQPQEIAQYKVVIDDLQRVALDEHGSRKLVETVAKEHTE